MKIERETVVILILIGLVLVPLWSIALYSTETQHRVVLSDEKGTIAPGEQFLPTPVEVNEFVAGVITWIALFGLVGMIYYTHQFVRTIGQSSGSGPTDHRESMATDGGSSASIPSFVVTDDRRLLDYWPAQYSTPGMIGLVVMSWSTILFSVLFTLEALQYSRAQFLGIYGGMLFLSLGVLVAVYVTWFMPSMHVVEDRGHEEKLTHDDEEVNE